MAPPASSSYDAPPLAFGLGTAWFGGKRGNDLLGRCVHAALDAGFVHIDEAEMYGNESATGAAIASWLAREGNTTTRADLFITSKILGTIESAGDAARAAAVDSVAADADAAAAAAEVAAVEAGCRASLARLRLEYLDLYLIHAPFRRADGKPFAATLPALWAAMERLLDLGLVRRIGVSNWREQDLRAVLPGCRVRPVCNQLEYHAYLQQPALAQYAWGEQRVATVSYGQLSPITKEACRAEGRTEVVAAAAAIGERLAPPRTAAQVLLRWAMQTAQAIVTTSTKPERIAENFTVLQFELSESDVASITDAGRAKPPVRCFWQDSLGTPLS